MDKAVYDFITTLPQHRTRTVLLLIASLTSAYVIEKKRRELLRFKAPPDLTAAQKSQLSGKRVGVDKQFLMQLRKILPVCIPGVGSVEFGLLMGLASILVARTWLDIWFSKFNGTVVRSIVSKDWDLFVRNAVVLFGVMMWPMSVVNNSLKLVINLLSLRFRERLTMHAHSKYLHDLCFYQVANLDNRVQNADQLLTQDIDKFSETLAHLYSDIAKPLVDIGLFAYKLGQSIGGEAPILMLLYFATSGSLLRLISPPFGKYIAIEQALEGQFRYAHSRVIAHSEEIAFYRGAEKERQVADGAFKKITDHLNRVYALRFFNGIFDSVLVKYCATQLAFFILSRPVFGRRGYAAQNTTVDSTQIMEDYSRNSGYLINLSQAVGRLVLAGRDLTRFAGFTSRVSELFDVLDSVNKGTFQRTIKSQVRCIKKEDQLGEILEVDAPIIEFDRVPIVTPNGDVLVNELSFKVERGMNCLITGPNGCGKSSLFRILSGLWPLFGGTVRKPKQAEMFYVPQRPYLPMGTLRDQIIYPDSHQQAIAKGFDDEKLQELMRRVHLEYLITREPLGFDTIREWTETLSGGEKQRVAMARLFYHRPMFANLDECTSAVSIDVEGEMYEYATKELGITLFTISHRPSLFKYHDYLLRFDGEGNCSFMRQGDGNDPFAFAAGANLDDSLKDQDLNDSSLNDDNASNSDSEEKSEVMFYFDSKDQS